MHGFLWSALLFLLAAVIVVPISKRLGLGAVLGYLIAGILIGPSCFQLVTNVEDILHFSELGVVLLLFLIGLELEPRKLWQMRLPIFGLGTMQVLLTMALFAGVFRLLGFTLAESLVVGMGFSLSSTALVLQVLQEKKRLATDSGRSSFSILLFQDIAVIPMIAVLPLFASQTEESNGGTWLMALKVLGLLIAVVVVGRVFLRPLFNWIASIHLREIFTALALLLVVGMSLLMQSIELSMGLGAFMAGLLLADSEYKHAIETDIEPFKGLLLGLFFMSVGMTLNLADLVSNPSPVLSAVAALLVGKFLVLVGLGFLFKISRNQIVFFALGLSQMGEFAFVLFDSALALKILSPELKATLVATGALSIFLSPILMKLYDILIAPKLEGAGAIPENSKEDLQEAKVIIAGFGRVGQIVGRFLFANGIKATVLDFEPTQIELLRKFGFKVFYGDATRSDLLRVAGAEKAEILVVAIDDVESSVALVDMAKREFPHLRIVARARNVAHVFDLLEREVDFIERETFDASLRLGRKVLEIVGVQKHRAFSLAQTFRDFDENALRALSKERKNDKLRISLAQQARVDIERMFKEESDRLLTDPDSWGNEYESKKQS